MLIRAFGRYWNPKIVDWGSVGAGNRGLLQGKILYEGGRYTIDFWEAQGIYVLHEEFQPVYIGKAYKTRLGPRLRNHLTDRFAGRWDMFSWYTLSTVNRTTGDLRDAGKRQLNPDTVNDTLEAVAILLADPPLNRRQESIPDAQEAEQVSTPHPKAIRSYLEDIIERLDNLDSEEMSD